MNVSEERKKAEDSDNLELNLMAPVRQALRHGVQPKEQAAEQQNGEHQNDAQYNHEHVRITRSGDERRQMLGGSRVKLVHSVAPVVGEALKCCMLRGRLYRP